MLLWNSLINLCYSNKIDIKTLEYMRRYFMIILGCALLISCSPKRAKNLPKANFVPTLNLMKASVYELSNSPDTLITPPSIALSMERQPCLIGKCPVYKIQFFEDGKVTYQGKSDVSKVGKYETTITKEELNTLLIMAKNIDYFELENLYPTVGKIIYEVPLTITFVRYHSEFNLVENHHDAPVSLIRFEQHIEELVENLEWKQITE